jgi:hypothetical protein
MNFNNLLSKLAIRGLLGNKLFVFMLTAYNSTYKKLAVEWLYEVLFFVSSFVVADSLVLRNRQLLVAAKR